MGGNINRGTCDRRTFLESAAALAALSAWPARPANAADTLAAAPRKMAPCLVRGAFFYPPAEVVLAGECEDSWAPHEWFTWPGNQFEPEAQQAKFMEQLRTRTKALDVDLKMDRAAIYTDAAIEGFIREISESKPAALLLVNFWNSFSKKIEPILDAYDGPIILYHPVGANHQLPPARFRSEPRLHYIHSIEHWSALEEGLRAVHAMNRMGQSRLLRVADTYEQEADEQDPFFGLGIHNLPGAQFTDIFDNIRVTDAMRRMAEDVRAAATGVTDLKPEAFLDAVRAHATVLEVMQRHEADAITIRCLFLKHRKPCLSFSMNNGRLVPCGCENDLNATLSLMLGANLFGRGGFQHNPEFDLQQNCYFGAHCTCTTRLEGPDGPDAPYALRPFFHQMPKTLAYDVQWPAGAAATLFKYRAAEAVIDAWAGEVVSSPATPPTGGCATRVLVKMRDVKDVCEVYPGPHPILYCGDFTRQSKTFAQLYGLEVRTNA